MHPPSGVVCIPTGIRLITPVCLFTGIPSHRIWTKISQLPLIRDIAIGGGSGAGEKKPPSVVALTNSRAYIRRSIILGTTDHFFHRAAPVGRRR